MLTENYKLENRYRPTITRVIEAAVRSIATPPGPHIVGAVHTVLPHRIARWVFSTQIHPSQRSYRQHQTYEDNIKKKKKRS